MPSPGRTSCSWWTVAVLGALSLLVLPGVARAEPPRAQAVDPAAVDEEPRPEPPSSRLALAGGLLFGSSYAISLIAGTVSVTTQDAQLPELYAPLAGPWIAIPNVLQIQKRRVGGDPAASGADWLPAFGLGVLGVTQMLGAVCLVGYAVDKHTSARADHEVSSVRVVPYVGVASAGLAGSF